MSYLPSLPTAAVLLDVFKAYPGTSAPLIEYHEVLMRGSSPLRVAERELIAGFVSRLNACQYCAGVHVATTEAFGTTVGLVDQLVADLDTAPVDEKLKPILRYVRTLTEAPSRVSPRDAERVLEAGWNEQALHDAVSICALFNFMNRLVEGLRIRAADDYFAGAATRLRERGYAPLSPRSR